MRFFHLVNTVQILEVEIIWSYLVFVSYNGKVIKFRESSSTEIVPNITVHSVSYVP